MLFSAVASLKDVNQLIQAGQVAVFKRVFASLPGQVMVDIGIARNGAGEKGRQEEKTKSG